MKEASRQGNQGFILMATLLVGTVLTILSSAYFSTAISQNNIAKKQFVLTRDFYNAEAGIAYGYVEAQAGTETHNSVSSATTPTVLSAKTSAPKLAGLFGSASIGSLVIANKLKVKVYKRGTDTIVLARALDAYGNEVGSVHRYLISHRSLYRYFEFYADSTNAYQWRPGWSRHQGKILNGTTKAGGIHVNGDIVLQGSGFLNLSELSVSRDFYYRYAVKDLSTPYEPGRFDFRVWDNTNNKYLYYINQSTCGNNGCRIDGRAPLDRFDTPPYNFRYPLARDIKYVPGAPIYEALDGQWRQGFSHSNMWIEAYDVTDDWTGSPNPKSYGSSFFWMKNYDSNNNGADEEVERKRIPKILPNCSGDCNYTRDMYNGEPGDNKALTDKLGSTISCAELPVRWIVVDDTSPPTTITNSAYKYEALKWLVNKEAAAGEYLSSSGWLTPYYTSGCSTATLANQNWESCEYDRVTLLSLELENGGGGLNLGGGKGLHNDSEYEIYKAIKDLVVSSIPLPGTLYPSVKNWIEDPAFSNFDSSTTDLRDDFFAWWRQRKYHHQEDLGSSGGSFSTDTVTVPAWERLFWEAWLNYWPPAHSKNHNQVYTPAHIYHAINPEWWEDLVYGSDRPLSVPDQTMSVPYFNTTNDNQADAFAVWLEGADQTPPRGLHNPADPGSSIVKFRNHGGEVVTPLNIKERYSLMAQEFGLYIKQDGANSFTARLNGGSAVTGTTLAACLSALDNSASPWIYEAQFYNPLTAAKGTYNPSSTTSINPYSRVYGQSSCPATASAALPPQVKVVEIDFSRMIAKGISLTRPVMYIESTDYDTRLVNGYTLPPGNGTSANPGGFTLASPYDVYVKAQRLTGLAKGYFNYEAADQVNSTDPLDSNQRPTAVITNSRVYLLSSEFKDMKDGPFPHGYRFPTFPYSLRDNTFLQTYCYPNWPLDDTSTAAPNDFPAKPATASGLTWAWITSPPRLNNTQQTQLLNVGKTAYENDNAVYNVKNNMVNGVGYKQYFNLAISSPFEPRGYRLEAWSQPLFVEGSFIKIGYWKNSDNTYVLSRYHSPTNTIVNCYEKRRFNITSGYEWMADAWKVANNLSDNPNVTYEYEERLWSPKGRPAGDFLDSGVSSKWEELKPVVLFASTEYNAFENDIPAN